MWLAAVLALAIGAAVSLYVFQLTPFLRAPMRATPLTSLPGLERYPSFSPDGNQIAFAWEGGNGVNQDIYIKVVGTGVPLRLTTHPAADQKPAWSPDGRYIAFIRSSEEGGGLFVIPALGGPERKVGSLISEHEWAAGPSWSPDGRLLALSEEHQPQGPLSIFLVSMESLEKRKLTSPPLGFVGDCAPAISPDGRTVAFNRIGAESGIYLVPVAGGELTRLTRAPLPFCERLAWTANGRELVFSFSGGAPESSGSLWRVSASGGTPERVVVGGENASNPAISRRGDRLAYEQRTQDFNIWQIEVPTATQPRRSATKLIASTRGDAAPQFSPDGTRIVFGSDRSNSSEIWVCDTAGSNLVQLTSFGGFLVGTPRWSPAGRHIAFDADGDPRHRRRRRPIAPRNERNIRRCGSELVEGWTMDLLRVHPHGAFGGLESACLRRRGGPGNQAGRICSVRVARWQVPVLRERHPHRRSVERSGGRRRRSTCAGFSQRELLGLLGCGGEGHLLREHRDWPATRAPISEL